MGSREEQVKNYLGNLCIFLCKIVINIYIENVVFIIYQFFM